MDLDEMIARARAAHPYPVRRNVGKGARLVEVWIGPDGEPRFAAELKNRKKQEVDRERLQKILDARKTHAEQQEAVERAVLEGARLYRERKNRGTQ